MLSARKTFYGSIIAMFIAYIMITLVPEKFDKLQKEEQQGGEQFTEFMDYTLNSGISLDKIRETLGSAPLSEIGEAGDYEASICYKVGNNRYIQFLSNELGGSTHELLGFLLSIEAPNKNCISLKDTDQKFVKELNIGGLYLGMAREEYLNTIKDKTSVGDDLLSVFFSYKISDKELKKTDIHGSEKPVAFDVTISIIPEFYNNKLIKVEVWKITTN